MPVRSPAMIRDDGGGGGSGVMVVVDAQKADTSIISLNITFS